MEFKHEIKHDEEEKKFYTEIDGKEAFAKYEIEDGEIKFHNTFVPEELRKKGIAKALYDAAAEYIKKNNLDPKNSSCAYAKEYFTKHYKKEE